MVYPGTTEYVMTVILAWPATMFLLFVKAPNVGLSRLEMLWKALGMYVHAAVPTAVIVVIMALIDQGQEPLFLISLGGMIVHITWILMLYSKFGVDLIVGSSWRGPSKPAPKTKKITPAKVITQGWGPQGRIPTKKKRKKKK